MDKKYELSAWHKKQATLLYEFASIDYLSRMKVKINKFVEEIENNLMLAKNQNRDAVLLSKQWGGRDTSANWGANAWPHLKDFQISISKQIGERAKGKYNYTDINNCARAISEYSTDWQTLEEENYFRLMFRDLQNYASRIDYTLDKEVNIYKWSDFIFSHEWNDYKIKDKKIPKFIRRNDVRVETGNQVSFTGVYILEGDENASLQFAWKGERSGKIIQANTFNSLGLAAIAFAGRSDLWSNGEKMLAFVLANKNNKFLKSDNFYNDSFTSSLAASLVARTCFTPIEGIWNYVELISEEFDDLEGEN